MVRAFWTLKQIQLSRFYVRRFSLWFRLDSRHVLSNLVTGECLVWNTATASFCQNNLVCPASDQVCISKIRFSNSLSSSFLLFFLFFLHVFEDEVFCVSTGYSNLRCPFSPICMRKALGGSIAHKPIRIKQYGTRGRRHGLFAHLLFAGWLFFEEVRLFNHWNSKGLWFSGKPFTVIINYWVKFSSSLPKFGGSNVTRGNVVIWTSVVFIPLLLCVINGDINVSWGSAHTRALAFSLWKVKALRSVRPCRQSSARVSCSAETANTRLKRGTSSQCWTTDVEWHPGEANRNVRQVDCTTWKSFLVIFVRVRWQMPFKEEKKKRSRRQSMNFNTNKNNEKRWIKMLKTNGSVSCDLSHSDEKLGDPRLFVNVWPVNSTFII